MTLINDLVPLWLQRQYLSKVSSQLNLFRQISDESWRFRCPFCGDSEKKKHLCRGNINTFKQQLRFKCYNCEVALSFWSFLKELPSAHGLYKEFIRDVMKERRQSRSAVASQPEPTKGPLQNQHIDLPTIASLPDDHSAKIYLQRRKIPPPFLGQFHYAESFCAWVNSLVPNKLPVRDEDSRIVIPFRDRDKRFLGFQGRALDPWSLRYITIMLDSSAPKIFGMDRVDESKRIYITEGPLDSTFIPNAIAMAGADFPNSWKGTVIYDNERFNDEIIVRMLRIVKRGFDLFVWPKQFTKYKDINDLVCGENLTQQELTALIDQNTFRGSLACLKLSSWRNA